MLGICNEDTDIIDRMGGFMPLLDLQYHSSII